MIAVLAPRFGFAPFAVHAVTGSARQWLDVASRWSEEAKLESLDPSFRPVVRWLLDQMRREGFQIRLANAWRHPQTQAALKREGRTEVDFSRHNVVRADGLRVLASSWAVDLSPVGLSEHNTADRPAMARFYRRLRELVRARPGLRSGADYSRRGVWADWGLGWDPGHVEQVTVGLPELRAASMRLLSANPPIYVGASTEPVRNGAPRSAGWSWGKVGGALVVGGLLAAMARRASRLP